MHGFQVNSTVAALVVAGLVAPWAAAQDENLLVRDPFLVGDDPDQGQYEAGALRAQGPQGILGERDETVWGGNTSNFLVQEDSLSIDAAGYGASTGGRVDAIGVAGDTELTRWVVRGLEPPTSEIFYMSALINRGSGLGVDEEPAPVNPGSYVLTGFTNPMINGALLDDPAGGDGNMFGLTWGFGGNDAGGYDVIVRHRRRTEVGSNDDIRPHNDVLLADAAADQTYLVVLKFEFNNVENLTESFGNDTVTYWVGGDGTGFDVSSEQQATATAEATGTLTNFGFNTDNDLRHALFAQRAYEAEDARFDELRLGTTFESVVTGPSAAIPGDADGDGDVDAFDLGLWQTQFGMSGEGLSADFDADGDVDAFDLGIWQINFGTGLDGNAVPEPAAASLFALSALGLARRRHRTPAPANPRRTLIKDFK